MDKQEQREIIGEIKKAYARGDFDRVLTFADEMNIRKLADSRTLEMVADAHAAKGELEDAREILLMAYEKTPMGRKMAYKLSELSIALDDLDNAVEFYEDFCKMAPHDNDRYLLKYKIGKAGGVSAEDLVKVLSVYCSKEVDEKWMYELAALYYKLRDKEKCLEICDNIILWFANGDYVQKAKALKARLGAEAEAAVEKENNGASQLGTDIPLEGFIDMSGQEPPQSEELEKFLDIGAPTEKEPEADAATDDFGMEEINDAFLEEVLQDKKPDQDMAIGDAMAIAEAKEQAEMVQAAEAFERVTRTEAPVERTPSVRKYGRFEGTVTFETVPEKTAEGTPFEVNGEVITLPKTTFEDMSHDWTIPEELLNAEDAALQPEVFEEPVYGSHRYVPPTERPEPEFEEPVYGAHRVMTRAEEEARAADLQAQLEAAKEKAEEEAARAAQLQAQLEAAQEKIKQEKAEEAVKAEETTQEPEAAEEVAAVPEEEAPAVSFEEPAAEYTEEAPAVFEEPAEVVYDAPAPEEEKIEEVYTEQQEAGLQVSDNPIIAAVIEPVAEPLAEVERAREGFDDAFPAALNQQEMFPEREREVLFAGEEKEDTEVRTKEDGGSATILFAISPQEDENAPDELILPEAVQAEVNSAKVAERVAPEHREPVQKPTYSSRLQTAIEPEPAPQGKPAAVEAVPTEVIRPTRSSKYSSVSSLFAEDETDNIDGQITLDSMFATYSKREVAQEPVIPEMPQETPSFEQTPAEAVVVDEFPVNDSAIVEDENEPPLITELGEDFGRKPEPEYETPAYQEPEMSAEPQADGMSDFEKAMLAYDTARAEGKEGFDFKSLFTKASDEEFEEDSLEGSEEEELEEYEEQLYDEPEYDEYEDDEYEDDEYEDDEYEDDEYEDDEYEDDEYEDDEYEDDEYEDDEYEDDEYEDSEYKPENKRLDDDYEVGFGETEEPAFEEEYDDWDEGPVEDYEEEYEEESEDGFEQELDDYEEGEFEEEPFEDGEFVEDDYVEEYEEEAYEDGYVEDDYEEALPVEEPYEEEPATEFDDSFEEDETAEEPVEAYEEESYEEAPEEYEDEYTDEYEDGYEDEYDDYEYEDGGYEMPAELKEELAEFLLIDGMEERINGTIGSLIEKKRHGDPTGGNLIVTGDTKSGKTYLTIAVIKAVGQEIGGNSRVAKVKAQALNGKNMMKVFEKIAGSDLLIENVGYLNDETVDSLIDILSSRNLSSMVALEGNQLAIDNMISKHPELNELFQTRLNVSELSLAQWADLACQYAEEQGYTVGDMALLALHAKIDELNVPTERLGYDNIRGIIDNAIANASKRGGGKFRFGSKKRKGNAKQLEEADFM